MFPKYRHKQFFFLLLLFFSIAEGIDLARARKLYLCKFSRHFSSVDSLLPKRILLKYSENIVTEFTLDHLQRIRNMPDSIFPLSIFVVSTNLFRHISS